MIQKHTKQLKASNERSTLLDVYEPSKVGRAPVLIFLHGFKGFKDWGHFPLVCQSFCEAGYWVLAMNFSHNGGTIAQAIDFPDLEAFSNNSYWKELQDVKHLFKYLRSSDNQFVQQMDLERINLLGHSRGGGIALLAAQHWGGVNSVISWAAVADFFERLPSKAELDAWKQSRRRYIANSRTGQQMPMNYTFVEELYKHQDKLDIQRAVSNLSIPQLIIHGIEDTSVLIEHARRLKEWNPKAEIVEIKGAQHTFGGSHPWEEKSLPKHTKLALEKSLSFLELHSR
jgi:pimeloyl-ACP methyl ester carboxylesterase